MYIYTKIFVEVMLVEFPFNVIKQRFNETRAKYQSANVEVVQTVL